MRLWPRRKPPAPVGPRANPTQIAILEQELLGIAPPPGSAAYAATFFRKAGTCVTHRPVDTSHLRDAPGSRAVCAGCSNEMRQAPNGEWVLARHLGIVES